MKTTILIMTFLVSIFIVSYLVGVLLYWMQNISEKDFKAKSLINEQKAIDWLKTKEAKLMILDLLMEQTIISKDFEAYYKLRDKKKELLENK